MSHASVHLRFFAIHCLGFVSGVSLRYIFLISFVDLIL
jgi:hypothetical protein